MEQSHDPKVSEEKDQYRSRMLNVLKVAAESSIIKMTEPSQADVEISEQVLRKFVNLAETLDVSKALAIHFEDTKHEGDSTLGDFRTNVVENINEDVGALLSLRLDLFDHPSIRKHLLHPLMIALLAYRMGGPVNAANTACAHSWTLPEGFLTPEQNFHIEGGCGDFFDDHRITLVWEMTDGEAKAVSGNHSIFLAEEATPRPLIVVDAPARTAPTTIIYNSQNATLYYDCLDPKVVRQSITLDFHLNTITNEDLYRFSVAPVDEGDLQNLTLARLLVGFPVTNYDRHFHRLLFSVESLNAILTKLFTLRVPQPRPSLDLPKQSLQHRLDRYAKDNRDSMPVSIRDLERKVPINGIYSHPDSFRRNLWIKACRDVHLSLGMDVVPQSLLDENRECARKFIRDMSDASIVTRLARYAPVLLQKPYTSQDLLSPSNLYRAARLIEQRCLALIAAGFFDNASNLLPVAALADALRDAFNGIKANHVSLKPRVFDSDTEIFGARCLYLFWCSDQLVYYLDEPKEGPCMTLDAKVMNKETTKVRLEIERVAGLLLRNWVAWGLIAEELTQGGHPVRRPPEFEELL